MRRALLVVMLLLLPSSAFARGRGGGGELGALLWILSDRLSIGVGGSMSSGGSQVDFIGLGTERHPVSQSLRYSMATVGVTADFASDIGPVFFLPTFGASIAGAVGGDSVLF